MSDTLKLAMRISAVDLFSGVLRRFRNEITGTGAAAKAVQRDYDNMVRHTSAGLKSLAVGGYLAAKLKPAVGAAADLQESLLSVEGILQGAHPDAKKLADQMERVKRNSIEVSNHMKFGAKEVTDVTRELIQGGVPLDAILDRLDKRGRVQRGAAFSVEALAEVRHEDPATTAMNIANVGHSFQLRPEQYAEATDLIARGAITASGGLTQLFHNLDQVGARAHMFGNMDLKSTVIALKALSPLGEEAGSDLGAALAVMTGGSHRGQKWRKEWGLDFYKGGKFIGLDAALDQLHAKMAKQTQEQRNVMLGEVFGQTGGKAITQLLAPSLPGVKSYAEIKAALEEQATLEQQVATWEKGLTASWQEFTSTNQNTLAVMFDPMLGKMTDAIKLANKLNGSIGEIASKHKGLAEGVSATAAGAIAAAAGYGVYRLARGGLSLRSFLKGKAGLAAGIAEGKAVQAATGVQPVYVTNFPAGFGGLSGAAATAAGGEAAAAGAGAGATAARAGAGFLASSRGFALADLLPAFALGVGIKKVNDLMAPAAAAVNASIAASGERSQAKALGLNDRQMALFNQIETQDMPYGVWAKKQGSKAHGFDDYDKWVREQVRQQIAASAPAATQVGGSIEIKLSQEGRARVGKVVSKNPNVPIDVGSMMAVP